MVHLSEAEPPADGEAVAGWYADPLAATGFSSMKPLPARRLRDRRRNRPTVAIADGDGPDAIGYFCVKTERPDKGSIRIWAGWELQERQEDLRETDRLQAL